MLSRLSFRNAFSQLKSVAIRGNQTSALSTVPPADHPDRLVRPIYEPPVRFAFIPDSWFTFFYPKTGVTGPYMFMIGVSTYLISKEYYVLEHEFANGLSLLSIILFVRYKFGDKIAKTLDEKMEKHDALLEASRQEDIDTIEQNIKELEKQKLTADAKLMIYDIKKQNVLIQLEAIYRERLAQVYHEIKKRLDYNAQVEEVRRRIAQKHMVQWITNSVLKAITPEQEKANLLQCITDLEALSARA